MSLSAPRTRAGGNLSIDLERRLVEGELTGRVEQLQALAALLPARARGRARVSRRAPRPEDGAQSIALTARGSDFRALSAGSASSSCRQRRRRPAGAPGHAPI